MGWHSPYVRPESSPRNPTLSSRAVPTRYTPLPMSRSGVVLVLLAVLGAAALIVYARTADAAFAPAGDIALIETYTIDATRGQLLLGPYSRYGWHHPGPLYFYLQAPFYVMSGYRSAGLSAGALAINLSALGILVWVCFVAAGRGFLPIGITAARLDLQVSGWVPRCNRSRQGGCCRRRVGRWASCPGSSDSWTEEGTWDGTDFFDALALRRSGQQAWRR